MQARPPDWVTVPPTPEELAHLFVFRWLQENKPLERCQHDDFWVPFERDDGTVYRYPSMPRMSSMLPELTKDGYEFLLELVEAYPLVPTRVLVQAVREAFG